MHRRIPPAIPCRASPLTVGGLEGQEPRTRAFGGNPCTLCSNLALRCVRQIAHRLPSDGRVRVEKPLYDGTIRTHVGPPLPSRLENRVKLRALLVHGPGPLESR